MHYDYYVASRWRNKSLVDDLVQKIRAKGKTIYSFFEGDGRDHAFKNEEQTQSPEAFMQKFESIPNWQKDERIKEIFFMDIEGLKNADNFILLLPAGKSAHIEVGIAYALKKHCIVIGEQKEAEASYVVFDEFYEDIEEFLKQI